MGGAYSMHGRDCKTLVQKAEGMRQFGRPRHRWEDNMKMNLREAGSEDVNRFQQWAVVNMVMNVQVP
jgi:hypothetical protein